MVECKSGDTYDGTLVAADTFMNVKMSDCTIMQVGGADGHQFKKCSEVFVRGNTIRGIQFSQDVLEKHQVIVK